MTTMNIDPSVVTIAQNTIHNPANIRHFMKLKPISRQVQIVFENSVIAESRSAIRVLEVGYDFYEPVIYFPRSDVTNVLVASNAKQTHCPLKGDATYFDLIDEDGDVRVNKIAWSYVQTFEFSSELKDMIAFDPSFVTIVEAGE